VRAIRREPRTILIQPFSVRTPYEACHYPTRSIRGKHQGKRPKTRSRKPLVSCLRTSGARYEFKAIDRSASLMPTLKIPVRRTGSAIDSRRMAGRHEQAVKTPRRVQMRLRFFVAKPRARASSWGRMRSLPGSKRVRGSSSSGLTWVGSRLWTATYATGTSVR